MRRWILGLTAAAAIGVAPEAEAIVNIGDVTPNFTKLDLTNTPRSLYDYRGKVVVLFLLGST